MEHTGLVLDICFTEHDTGPGHPERPARIERISETLERRALAGRCRTIRPTSADDAMLTGVHDPGHLRRVEEACASGRLQIDSMDTAICPESDRVARLAAGSLASLCAEVADGALARGFAAVRPPGHHAERDLAMGFCLYNSVAVAAQQLRVRHGVERLLIVDWDVHHGNGTQHLFEERGDVFYFSVHQWPLYPGTGSVEEVGRGPGLGATMNCPLPPGAGDDEFLGALSVQLKRAAAAFRPEFVLVSAGFDAHAADPLADLEVSTEAYAEATRIVLEIAESHAGGRLVSVLEGGYDLDALAESVAAHVAVLLEAG